MDFRIAIAGLVLAASFLHANAQDMSIAQARREVQSALEKMYRGELNNSWRPMTRLVTHPVKNIRVRGDGLEYDSSRNQVTDTMWGTRETVAAPVKLAFRDLQPISLSDEHPSAPAEAWFAGPPDSEERCTRKCGDFFWAERADAERFARAMNVLIAAARSGRRDDFEQFRMLAAQWRSLPRKPPLSAQADRLRLLAEHALQQNDLANAAARYDEALDIFPGWPEGWMNAALLCEAMKDYQCAADRVRHYLELLPNSRDAAAAREKLVIWEELAQRRGG